VDFPGLFGERRPDVLCVLHDVLDQARQHLGPYVSVVLGPRGSGSLPAGRTLACARLDMGCAWNAGNPRVAAEGAGDQLVPELALKIDVRGEPPLETMLIWTAQIEHDHVDLRLRQLASPDSIGQQELRQSPASWRRRVTTP